MNSYADRPTPPGSGDLNVKIRAFIAGWNQRKHSFIWTNNPDEILAKFNRNREFSSRATRCGGTLT